MLEGRVIDVQDKEGYTAHKLNKLLKALTEYDPDKFARCVATWEIRANNASSSDSGTGALQLIELGANAQARSRDLRSNDPRAADNHQDLFERIQLAIAACIQCWIDERIRSDRRCMCEVFSSPDGRKALERAVQIGAKELLAQPVVQQFVSLAWSGHSGRSLRKVDSLPQFFVVLLGQLPQFFVLLPIVVLVPALDRWMGKDTAENGWGWGNGYLLRLPVFKFGFESVADLALALTLTLVPAADLVTTPTAPLLLYWIGSALLWECRQIATSESTSSSRLGRVRDRVAAYAGDRLNLVDATALVVSFASMVAVVSADDPDDTTIASLVYFCSGAACCACCSSRRSSDPLCSCSSGCSLATYSPSLCYYSSCSLPLLPPGPCYSSPRSRY